MKLLFFSLFLLAGGLGASTPTPTWTSTPVPTYPATFPDFACGPSASYLEPSGGKKLLGWVIENPSYQTFNWIHRQSGAWLRWDDHKIQLLDAYNNTATSHIPAIDAFGATLVSYVQDLEIVVLTASTTFTIPDSVNYIEADLLAGGGGGGGGGSSADGSFTGRDGSVGTVGGDTWVLDSSHNARGGSGGGPGTGGIHPSGGGGLGGTVATLGSIFFLEATRYGSNWGVGGTTHGNGGGGVSTICPYCGTAGVFPVGGSTVGGNGGPGGANSGSFGGGGSGGHGDGSYESGGGGASGLNGEYASFFLSVVGGTDLTITIGPGGGGGTGGTPGGGDSFAGGNGAAGGSGKAILKMWH